METLQKDLADEGLSNTTINGYTDFIRAIYNHAIEKELFKGINPASKLKSLKVNNDRERFLSVEEVNLLRKEIKDMPLLNLFVSLSLCTGGRLETILNIQKKDVNLDTNTINLTDLKNGTSYKGFINAETNKLLKASMKSLKENNACLVSIDGSKINARVIQNKLKPILDELFNVGLDTKDAKNRVVIHTLRHTFASLLAIQGTPILTIQKLMNHKDIEMTLRYAKLSPDNGRDEVVKLWKW